MLDAEEYLHLAINATQSGQHHAALEYLYKSLEQEPGNAKAVFLLAAEHAELGLYDRAIEGMKQSLQLAPDLEMARYQLALLYMQQGRIDECRSIWEYFSENAKESSIRSLSQGLLIIDENYQAGIDLINNAAESKISNSFLNQSINSIRDNLINVVSEGKEPKDTAQLHSMFLNAYNDTKFTKDED